MAKKQVEIKEEKQEAKHNIPYFDKNGMQKFLILEEGIFNKFKQADQHYNISKKYIEETWIHIWNKAIKSYLLYTGDREQYIKDWQSNVHIGAIRQKLDVYISYLEDMPMQYIVNGLDAEAFEQARPDDILMRTRKDFVENDINYISNITDFPIQAGIGLIEGMQFGTTTIKTYYQNFWDTELVLPAFINGEFMDITYKPKQINTPISEALDIYHIFPDPFWGRDPKYVTERNIVKINTFMELFSHMIMSEDNDIKFNKEDLADILTNKNNSNYEDFGSIRDAIYRHHNLKYSKTCSLYKNMRPTTTDTVHTGTPSEERKTDNVEFRLTEYEDRIILIANGYPVYVGVNKNHKLMYRFVNAYQGRLLFTESPTLLLAGMEETEMSFFNNYVDNARSAAINRWMASRADFEWTPEIADIPPGWVLWADRMTENTLRPMPMQQVTDYGIMNITQAYQQGLSGVSEIDSGRASNLRVAAEWASLSGATNRRMNGYVKRFMNGISGVTTDWIYLHKKQLAVEGKNVWGFTKDIDGKTQTFDVNAKDLEGSYHVTMDSQAFFAMNKETGIQKKLDAFARFQKYLTPDQIKRHMQSIYRDMGMNPAIMLPEAEPIKEQPEEPSPTEPVDSLYWDLSPEQVNGMEIGQALNPQVDLGNGGQGIPN